MSESIYSVTLIDRVTGAMQRILVECCCTDDMQGFVESLSGLELHSPVVVDMTKTLLTSSGSLRRAS